MLKYRAAEIAFGQQIVSVTACHRFRRTISKDAALQKL
jgi:hypothetical protein